MSEEKKLNIPWFKRGDVDAVIGVFFDGFSKIIVGIGVLTGVMGMSQDKIVDCYNADIAPCKDCKYCFKKRGCSIKDDMTELYDYIDECDAVIIASPMHFGIVSAPTYKVFSRLQSYWSNRHIRHVEEEKPKPKYGALLVTTGGNWVNMELLIEGVADFAFDHMEAECIGSVFAKETDTHPVKENEKAKEKARYLGKRLNELCNRK